MPFPSRQRFTAKSGHQYSYVYTESKDSNKPTLLLLHGFPSHISDWIYQFSYFTNLGYGVVVPDLLGYGQSSKPSNPDTYRLKSMSDELAELLDHIKLANVIGVGHDFGSTLLSRVAAYHSARFVGCVFLAVGPPKLGTPFKVDDINAMTKQHMGFEMLGYITFIARDLDAQTNMEKNAKSVMSLLFCADEGKEWKEHFRPTGAFAEFVEAGSTAKVGEWYSKELQEAHIETFGRDGGYAGAAGWYKMWDQELFVRDEIDFENSNIDVPSLFVGPEGDSDMQASFLRAWVPNLRVAEVKSGHWVHIESSDQVNELMATFLKDNVL